MTYTLIQVHKPAFRRTLRTFGITDLKINDPAKAKHTQTTQRFRVRLVTASGAISQIPARTQVAKTGHTRQLRTPIGTLEFLQLKPEMFAYGVEWSDSAYRLATFEKALLDTFYISTRKKRRFSRLPELDLEGAGFSERRYRAALLKRHELSRQIGAAMQSRLEVVLGRESAESGRGDRI